MEKTYTPQNIESRWLKHWNDLELGKPSGSGSPYSIMLPPPNVTGTLHMGHGFQYSLMDALIRRKIMQQDNVLWQPGTDHAGIATQMVVERELSKEGLTRHDLGRDAFVKKAWDWRSQSGETITHQMKKLGTTMDWSRSYFSMDDNITHATYEAFIRLFEEQLIYRGQRLVNWDCKLKTAISDLEVLNEEQQGHLWYIKYPITNSQESITIATTRPETLLGDTAVAINPEDDRYAHLIGKTIDLPLTDRTIPIIGDTEVDMEFGTGCVKITPAHDFNDYEMGLRHNLPMINILDDHGSINDEAPADYQGLPRFKARDKIIEDLTSADLLIKTEPHTLSLPIGDRSGDIIEPRLTDQWFVKMESLAKPAMEVINNGKLKLVPDNWNKTYLQWLEGIQDWCISRQLWWGHRIPIWYDKNQTPYAGFDEDDVRKRYNLSDDITLEQDNDVLDTWFTASLWPFSSLGWPENTKELNTFYPSSVLVTGFDIIFFWVARMVMMGLKFMDDVPFHEVYITGLIRDQFGKKMSKSKGNVLDPLDLINGIALEPLIEKRTTNLIQPHLKAKVEQSTRQAFPNGINAHGTDALRFTFCALASTGRDINFDMGRIEGYRNFCNKLWNASRFVLMNLEGQSITHNPSSYSIADQWIKHQLNQAIAEVNTAFERYRFDLAAQALYEFTWNTYCDWYLELAKCTLNNPDCSEEEKSATRATLIHVLETLLRLLHPIIPFITEEIWQTIQPILNIKGDSILQQAYPATDDKHNIPMANDKIAWLQQLIGKLRTIRSEMGVAPNKSIKILFQHGTDADKTIIDQLSYFIKNLTKTESWEWIANDVTPPASASTVINTLDCHIPLADIIDKDEERNRLLKEIKKLSTEHEKSNHKLNNPNYIEKAPSAIIQKEKDKLEQTTLTLNKLKRHLERIDTL